MGTSCPSPGAHPGGLQRDPGEGRGREGGIGVKFAHCGDAEPSFPPDPFLGNPKNGRGGASPDVERSSRAQNSNGSGGIRTHAPGGTGALIQRLGPLGHATLQGAGRRPGI